MRQEVLYAQVRVSYGYGRGATDRATWGCNCSFILSVFCVWEREQLVRYKLIICRLSTNVYMLYFIFSSLCFTLLFYISGVVLKRVQIIPELLVAGNPPSSITAAIVSLVQNITTYVVIKELPSIFLIYRFRTVLLITCQLLAAYSLSKSEK